MYQTKLKWGTEGLSFSLKMEPHDDPRPYTPDDEANALSAFAELPDPDQRMSKQVLHPGATTFTPFPKLPIELRLKIWTAMFPRRRLINLNTRYDYIYRELVVDVNPRFPWKTQPRDCPPLWNQRSRGAPLPITLRINAESRAYTRTKYHILFEKPYFDPLHRLYSVPCFRTFKNKSRVVCINPAIDLVHLNSREIFNHVEGLRGAYDQDPLLFASITTLELRRFCYVPQFSQGLIQGLDSVLNFLPNLKTLHLVAEGDGIPHYIARKVESMERFISILRCWYEKMLNDCSSPISAIPEVILHSWRPLEGRTDEEHLQNGRLEHPWMAGEYHEEDCVLYGHNFFF